MNSKLTKLFVAATVATVVAGPGLANDGAIKARQSLMQLYAFNLGQLGAMAKGTVDYDAATATAAANNLLAAVTMDQMAMWPQGTDNASMPGKTRALPAIWTTFPAIAENGKAMAEAAAVMAEAAGKDLGSLQAAMGAVGKNCGSCHETYRQPQ